MLINYNSYLLLKNENSFFALYFTCDDTPFICKNTFTIYIRFNKYESLQIESLQIDCAKKIIYFLHGHIYDLNYNGRYDYFVNDVYEIVLDCMSER